MSQAFSLTLILWRPQAVSPALLPEEAAGRLEGRGWSNNNIGAVQVTHVDAFDDDFCALALEAELVVAARADFVELGQRRGLVVKVEGFEVNLVFASPTNATCLQLAPASPGCQNSSA